VRSERDAGIAQIVFDHPERRNAISAEMWAAIPALAADLARDASVRVVILRGQGSEAFVSGADISEFSQARSGVGAQEYDEANAAAFAALSNLPMPVVAAIHGFCVGGGCAIALTADLRIAADDAVFAIPAARLGLGYSAAGLELLERIVGLPAAKELFMTARRIGADEALRVGLVNRVVPKAVLDDTVRSLALEIASNAPLTLRAAKLAFKENGRESGARDHASVARAIRACYESADYAEGVRAFLEKRRPSFQGR
jgi:enoyl-CoA hydratase/carnithine racemase